jgi:hypothetical protein
MDDAQRFGFSVPSPSYSRRFKQKLTQPQKDAIERWLGIHYATMRQYQIHGCVPPDRQEVKTWVQDFTEALLNSDFICRQMVFRGLAANEDQHDRIEYLNSLLTMPNELMFPSHDSASWCEKIGRSFLTGPPDERPSLAVLLRIKPLTARFLRPFRHKAKNEYDVVLLQGARYRKSTPRKLYDAQNGGGHWEIDLEEYEGPPLWTSSIS